VGGLDEQDPSSLANVVTVALAVGAASGALDPSCVEDVDGTVTRGLPLIGLTQAACDAIVALQEDVSDSSVDDDGPPPGPRADAGEAPGTPSKVD
jgi:hypothetical protein